MFYDYVITKPSLDEALKHYGVKGMEWGQHKYIKRANGSYYYPEGSGGSSAKYSEYKKGDPDFDRKNYSEQNRVGKSDFFFFTKPDGSVVVLEEDMKWQLPKGTKLTPEMTKRLESFNQDGKLKGEEWNKAATQAITGNSGNGKLSEKDIDNLARETIRGNFKNGQDRKNLLGEDYKQVQAKVNEILKKGKKK